MNANGQSSGFDELVIQLPFGSNSDEQIAALPWIPGNCALISSRQTRKNASRGQPQNSETVALATSIFRRFGPDFLRCNRSYSAWGHKNPRQCLPGNYDSPELFAMFQIRCRFRVDIPETEV